MSPNHPSTRNRRAGVLAGALFSLALVRLAVAADPAPADSSAATGDSLNEIVVTANRREETLQKSALAIQAISGDEARSAGLVQITDFTRQVLGLQVGMNGGDSQIYIRGVGDFSANPLANPGVAFNVDGVYVARPEAVNSNFYDIQRIEVLKGPQGTLYGRNSSGGAINLITNSPQFGDTITGTLNVESGNYDLFRIDGAINAPVNDTLAMRLAFNKVSREGYLTDGTDDDKEQAVRYKALFKPSEVFSLLLTIDGAQVGGKGGGFVYRPQAPGASPWAAVSSENAYLYSLPGSAGVVEQGADSFQRDKFWNVSAQLDWDLGFATLTVIPAYRHSNADNLNYDAQRLRLIDRSDEETFEARLAKSSDFIKWVGGFYFFHEKNPGSISVDVGPSILYSLIPYNPSGTSYALFGETTISATDQWRFIVGARETTERRLLNGVFYISPDNGASFLDHENFNGDVTFNSFTWKLGTEYDLAPQSMLFATASTGFKAGGLTQTTPPDNVYQPEKVLAYELGIRNRFFDQRLQLNVEAFHWDYKNQQQSHLTFDDTGSINFLQSNAGDAKLNGANLDILAKVTMHDTVHAEVEYDHAKYTSFDYTVPAALFNPASTECRQTGTVPGPFLPLAVVDCAGFALPHVPLWSGLLDYTHDFDLPNGADVRLGASARLQSWNWIAVDFVPAERAPSFHMLNADLGYIAPSRKWSVTAYVRNITNATEYTAGVESTTIPGLISANISPPRTYGAQLHLDW
jgi:iron complex outermembrane recepter protein